jgi:hypothetical protein
MPKTLRTSALISIGLLAALTVLPLPAQRVGFGPDEFAARRAALSERIKDGAVILFGDAAAAAGSHFRQDNDFYYFTGNEDLGAILVLVPASRAAYLFLPPQTAMKNDDGRLWRTPRAAQSADGYLPVELLDEFLARSRVASSAASRPASPRLLDDAARDGPDGRPPPAATTTTNRHPTYRIEKRAALSADGA